MLEIPKYARNIRNLEASFLMSLYNHPAEGIKTFFDVEPQGKVVLWDGGPFEEQYQTLIEVAGKKTLVDKYQIGAIIDFKSKRQEDFCGRGIGKSMYDLALKCAWWGIVLPYADQAIYGTKKPMGVRFILVGNNMDTAKQLIGYIRNFLSCHPLFAAEIDPDSDSKLFLKLRNGTEYHVRAASDAARGLNPFSFLSERYGKTIVGRAIVVCDEFAYVVDQSFWNEVVEPYLSLGMSGFWAATTPNGKENAAYQCSLDKDFVVRRFPSWLNQYRNMAELLKIMNRLIDSGYPEVYDEEYNGIPQDQKYRYFSETLVNICHMLYPVTDEPLLWDDAYIAANAPEIVKNHGDLFLGCDPNKGKLEKGQMADASAICIVEAQKNPDRLVTRYAMEWGNPESTRPECRKAISTGDLIDKIRWLYHVLRIRYGKTDINPGKAHLEALKFEKNGLPPVLEAAQIDYIDTDSPKQSDLADEILLTKMEDRKIGIPPHTDLQRAFARYGTRERRTGFKKTDLIKAVIYAHVAAVEKGATQWAPGVTVTVDRQKIGPSMPDRTGKNPLTRTMTSVGTRTMTSVGKYGKTA